MASSGSFVCSGGYSGKTLLFEWWKNWHDVGANKTNIGYRLRGYGGSGYHVSGNFSLWINGSHMYFSSTRINLYNNTVITEGSMDIYHNADGSKYFEAYAEAGIYTVAVNTSGSSGWWLDQIPRQANVTGANNFNDEQNPYFTFSNPGGFGVRCYLEFAGTMIDKGWVGAVSAYTFSLNETERNLLRSKCPNSNSMTVRYVVQTNVGGNTNYWSVADRTMTIVNGNPTFADSDITYLDSDTAITAITGNNQHIVRNNSNLKVTFASAAAKKGASISKYDVTLNGATQTKTAPSTIDYGKVNSASNLTASIKVTDSRGNTVTANKTITIFDWVNPTAIISAGRVNNYEDNTKIKADVSISSVNSKNAIVSIQYRYKKTEDSTYSAYANLSNNTQITVNINKLFAWDFQILIKDKFGNTTYNFTIAKGMPIMFFDVEKISVGVNKFPSNNDSFETLAGHFEKLSVKNIAIKKYRYIRIHSNGSSLNTGNHISEVMAYQPGSSTNICAGKTATSSLAGGSNLPYITDGINDTSLYAGIPTGAYAEIDLGAEYEIDKVRVWRYFADNRTYYNTKVELLNAAKTITKVIFDSATNGTYAEWSCGKTFQNNDYQKGIESDANLFRGAAQVLDSQKEAWSTPNFQNGWSNYSGTPGFAHAGYIKINGIVYLRGLVKGGTLANGTGGTIFTLPPGYRPAQQGIFPAGYENAGGRCDVTSTGEVRAVANAGGNGYFSINAVSFPAEL